MNAEILSLLRARLSSGPRPLSELHYAARSAGSAWSADQIALLLDCLPDLTREGDTWRPRVSAETDPVAEALLAIVTNSPIPAAALLSRLPQGVVASAMKLCDIARHHPDLELLSGNRIRRR
jgi:hypothetical protein